MSQGSIKVRLNVKRTKNSFVPLTEGAWVFCQFVRSHHCCINMNRESKSFRAVYFFFLCECVRKWKFHKIIYKNVLGFCWGEPGWDGWEVHLSCTHRKEIHHQSTKPKTPKCFYDDSKFSINCKTFHINTWHYANQLPLLWATNVVCSAGKGWKGSQGNGKHYQNYITKDLGLKFMSSVLLWSVISVCASSQSCIKDATGRCSRLQWIL